MRVLFLRMNSKKCIRAARGNQSLGFGCVYNVFFLNIINLRNCATVSVKPLHATFCKLYWTFGFEQGVCRFPK